MASRLKANADKTIGVFCFERVGAGCINQNVDMVMSQVIRGQGTSVEFEGEAAICLAMGLRLCQLPPGNKGPEGCVGGQKAGCA